MGKKTSKKPKGLSIARNNMKFACSWKKGESYSDKQQFSYLVNRAGKSDKWTTAVNIGKAVTSRSVSLSLSNYFPYSGKPKITEFKFRVRGVSDKEKWSDWVSQAFSIDVPAKPSLSASPSESNYNQCTFSWSVDTSNTHKVFTDVEYQTKLVENYDYGGDKGWTSGTGGASGSKTYTESAATIASGSHTRWFRVRSRGAAGVSEWRYSCRVYSAPYAASNVNTMEKDPDTEHALFYDASHNNIIPLESESYYPLKASYAIEDEATTSDSDGTVEGFITRLYEAFLGRKPDEGGLRAWSDSLKSRKTTGAKVVYRFVYSDEFRNNPLNNSDFVRAMYQTIFGREGDKAGVSSWIDILERGCTRKKILAGFVNSDEMKKLCASLGIESGSYHSDEIVDLHSKVTFFVSVAIEPVWKHIVYNADRALQVIDAIKSKNLSNQDFIRTAYIALLDREPDQTGMQSWINILNQTGDRTRIIRGFVKSDEFMNLCNSYGIIRGDLPSSQPAQPSQPTNPSQPSQPNNPPVKYRPTFGDTVYITKTGKKYHNDGCSSLRQSRIPISYSDALKKGYDPCELCIG